MGKLRRAAQIGLGLLNWGGYKRQRQNYEQSTQEQIDETLAALDRGYRAQRSVTRRAERDLGLLDSSASDANRYYWQDDEGPPMQVNPDDLSLGPSKRGDVGKSAPPGGTLVRDARKRSYTNLDERGAEMATQDQVDSFNAGKDVISDLEQRKTDVLGLLDEFGTSTRGDIDVEFGNAGENIEQSLIDRGLYGSTVSGSMQTGLAREKSRAITSLNERVNTLKADATGMLDADIINAKDMQRRESANWEDARFATQHGDILNLAGIDLGVEGNYFGNLANVWQGMNLVPPDQSQLTGIWQGIGSSWGAEDYRKYLEDQQTLFGGQGGAFGQSLGLIGGGIASAYNPAMALPYLLVGSGAGYGLGSAFDR